MTEYATPESREIFSRINNDENLAFHCEIPDSPLEKCTSPAEFAAKRQEILQLFADKMYGSIPPAPESMEFKLINSGSICGTLGIKKEIDIICRNQGKEKVLHLLLVLPARQQKKIPCFFGLNFFGNASTCEDESITHYPFTPPQGTEFIDCDPANFQRGKHAYRFCYEKVLAAGFASATIWYGDLFPDHKNAFEQSIMPLFYSREEWDSPSRPSGALSAWAWGIMRATDCLTAQPEIDSSKIIVHGHSRLGKTALWAGANDERIALTVSNCSGCGGAKLTKRNFGENLEWLLLGRHYWFAPGFTKYCCKEEALPFDQHFLMGCCAPRHLYVASAAMDINADPFGEYLALLRASKVWKLFDREALPEISCPLPDDFGVSGGNVRYFRRSGRHDITEVNWEDMLKYAARL